MVIMVNGGPRYSNILIMPLYVISAHLFIMLGLMDANIYIFLSYYEASSSKFKALVSK